MSSTIPGAEQWGVLISILLVSTIVTFLAFIELPSEEKFQRDSAADS